MTDKRDRIKELVELLNKASESYYAKDVEIMSNYEYDSLYDELVALEEETGIILSNSPTQNVGYEAVKELEKERHAAPMLSLSKTKSRDEMAEFAGFNNCLLSWKLDGLTVVLTYRDGKLEKAVTRGNGEIGEVITLNAKTFENLPVSIPFKGELVLRGESVITYSDFEKINAQIPDEAAKYKNPRNLCSGSVRQLNSAITAKRHVKFFAFTFVSAEGMEFAYKSEQMNFLKEQGFEIVESMEVSALNMSSAIEEFAKKVKSYDVPSDGLVLTYDSIEYSRSLGRTAKFPRDSIAFKWADETAKTHLREIFWSASRTGLINPVAIFDPVDLEGTEVKRASLHNLTYIRDMKLGVGDEISVYKANMIIPQLSENFTKSDNIEIPSVCPVCGAKTEIRGENESLSLYCTGADCPAKKIKKFALLASRDALNIEGLSEATIEKFIAEGFLHEYRDLFHLDRYRNQIVEMEGFGEKSYNNLIDSIEKARTSNSARLLYSLGVDNIGVAMSKLLMKEFDFDVIKLSNATVDDLVSIDQVGEVLAGGIREFFDNEKNLKDLNDLMSELTLVEEINDNPQTLAGLTFVITGDLINYTNRDELKKIIEDRGGKVSGSVSKKTAALINNDATSSSNKNKTAKELGIPILTEAEFEEKYL